MQWIGKVDGWLNVGFTFEKGRVIPAEYTLTGGPIVRIGRDILGDDLPTRVFSVGPFLFYPIETDDSHFSIIAAHINGPLWWLAVLRYWASVIERRILVTLFVWGLADHPMERTQIWDDVYLMRWMKKGIER